MTCPVRLKVQYDGTDFHGWQKMPGVATVEGSLEAALGTVLRQPVKLSVAGRTDAGVHAEGQICSFNLPEPLDDAERNRLLRGANALLPPGISVVQVTNEAPDFDARHSAVGKRYVYRIHQAPYPSVFHGRFRWHLSRPLDTEAMQRAAQSLLGEHDFESFRASGCQAEHAVRYLWHANVQRMSDDVLVEFRGNAFVRNQVRIMVGTLVEVGLGAKSVDDVPRILLARDRTCAGRTAPPQGLSLAQVYFPSETQDAAIPLGATFPGWPPSQA